MTPSVDASCPAFNGDLATLGVDTNGDLARKALAGLDDQRRIANGDRAKNDARKALREPILDMIKRADAAAELHGVFCSLQDGLDGSTINRYAGKCTIQIDHMQPFKALILKGLRLRSGVGVVDCRLIHVAKLQPYALAVFQIDRGKKDHGFHLRKLAMRARPSAWLFSG